MTLQAIVKASLWVTAPFNLIAAYAFAFPAGLIGSLLSFPQTAHPFYAYFSGAMVGLFGLVYVWLALQDSIFKPLLLVGACGKLTAVLISVGLYVSGRLSGIMATVITGDLFFVALWFYFLLHGFLQHGRSQAQPAGGSDRDDLRH